MKWFYEIDGDILERFDLYLSGEYVPCVDERKADYFYLVHTISSDNAQGAGFAKVLNDRYHFRDSLCADLAENFPGFGTDKWHFSKSNGDFYRIPLNPNYTLGEARRMKFEGEIGSIYATERCPNILGLVTKEHYYNKPTLDNMRTALKSLHDRLNTVYYYCDDQPLLTEIMMPHIGCGLDKLNWEDVKEIIFEELHDLGEKGYIRVVAMAPSERPVIRF
jgi:hypothetical protein